jgi:hypothetical protein
VLEGLLREGILRNVCNRLPKNFLEAGKRHLAGDTPRAPPSDRVNSLHWEASTLKEVVNDLTLESRLHKNACLGKGARRNGHFTDLQSLPLLELNWV